jgi:prevent-host-death family protein
MPKIIPSSDLRNRYNEVSLMCHETNEPVYITKNGAGDLAVMSIEAYEKMVDKYELYNAIEKGLKSIEEGKLYAAEEVFNEIYGDLDK